MSSWEKCCREKSRREKCRRGEMSLGRNVVNHNTLFVLVYTEAEHPRWGLIQSVVSEVDLQAGTEIFTHYGYSEEKSKFPSDYPWYWKAKKDLDEEEEKTKKREILMKKNGKRNKKLEL